MVKKHSQCMIHKLLLPAHLNLTDIRNHTGSISRMILQDLEWDFNQELGVKLRMGVFKAKVGHFRGGCVPGLLKKR